MNLAKMWATPVTDRDLIVFLLGMASAAIGCGLGVWLGS